MLSPKKAIIDRTSAGVARGESFQLAEGVVRGDTGLSALSFSERGLSLRASVLDRPEDGFYFASETDARSD